jgi:hypothetical protein
MRYSKVAQEFRQDQNDWQSRLAGYPERYAMQALGHNSIAVHRAYARKAQVVIPSLEDYEKKLAPASDSVIVPMAAAAKCVVGSSQT